jgi:TBC1 domain family member 8/9
MSNAFEYGDALLPRPEGEDEDGETPQIGSNQPYLSLATFRMVLLADEVLESFFETDLSASFRLELVPLMELPPSNNGFLGGIWSNIATDTNVKLFHKLSDEVGKTIGRHQVIHRPSIGRYTSIEDTRPRESLLTPAMRHSSSESSLKQTSTPSSTETKSASGAAGATLIAATDAEHHHRSALSPTSPAGLDPLAQATNVVANAFLERTPFAIDDAGDDDEDDDDDDDEAEQDDVLDEVRFYGLVFVFFFSFHMAECICSSRWMPSLMLMRLSLRMRMGRSRMVSKTVFMMFHCLLS